MKKERFVELVNTLNEEQFKALISGINSVTHEWGWEADLDENDLILECWKKN